jgi:orotate phosphoribosyltransferase
MNITELSTPDAIRSAIDTGTTQLAPHLSEHVMQHGLPVTLRGGEVVDWYFDGRAAVSNGSVLRQVGQLLVKECQLRGIVYEAVGGLTLGATPITTAIAFASPEVEMFEINDKNGSDQRYGRGINGADVSGKRVFVVDDTTSTGGSFETAFEFLDDAGAGIVGGCTILDRSGGATEALFAARDLPFFSLYQAESLLALAGITASSSEQN